ncbi:MAG TPA: TIGR03066 family protein [Gemmataceae bacterium]|nr:TIGR03066 family protein [Gemmataceae bacterium]
MNAIKWLGVVAIVSLAGAGTRADDKVDYAKLLVGKWEVTKADPGTVPEGTLVEFTKDGKMKITAKKDGKDTMIEGTYKVEKNTFTMTVKIGDEEHTQTITITKISEKEMSTKDKDGKAVELKKK